MNLLYAFLLAFMVSAGITEAVIQVSKPQVVIVKFAPTSTPMPTLAPTNTPTPVPTDTPTPVPTCPAGFARNPLWEWCANPQMTVIPDSQINP